MVAIIVQFSPAVAFLYDHSPQGLGIFAICFMTCDVYQVFIWEGMRYTVLVGLWNVAVFGFYPAFIRQSLILSFQQRLVE
jgi:hypothetical protein